MRSVRERGTILVRRLIGAVDKGFNPSICPFVSFRAFCQKKELGFYAELKYSASSKLERIISLR